MTKKSVWVTNASFEFESQPCLAIYYAHDDTFDQSSCCDMIKVRGSEHIQCYAVIRREDPNREISNVKVKVKNQSIPTLKK